MLALFAGFAQRCVGLIGCRLACQIQLPSPFAQRGRVILLSDFLKDPKTVRNPPKTSRSSLPFVAF